MGYETWPTWEAFLADVDAGVDTLIYHAPMDRYGTSCAVVKRYKNGKVRIATQMGESITFTADAGHLPRMEKP